MKKPNSEIIKVHLSKIARPRDPFENPIALAEVQSYIETELISYGYSIKKSPFSFQGMTYENVVASKSENSPGPKFIIGAHFDAVPGTDGADDNASGIAALLEAARVLADTEEVKKIDFLAFNLEESGLTGSSAYARELSRQKKPLIGMISLEMIGYTDHKKGSQMLPLMLRPFYPDTGNFLALVGDSQSKKLLKLAKKGFSQVAGLPVEAINVPAKGLVLPETRLSDHSPFWDAGYPALLVTDTSFFRNPYYHTPGDKIQTLDLDFLMKVTEGVVRFVESL